MMPPEKDGTATRRTALLIGHPGHELRVFGWASTVHPTVYVLTDGSGVGGANRLSRSTQLLSTLRATIGTVYGRFSDIEIYQAMLDHQFSRFTAMADEIAQAWIREQIEVVVSDANEGYSPTHDLCCEIAQAATELIYHQTGQHLERYTFCLTEWECETAGVPSSNVLRVRLNDQLLDEKLAAAKSYDELRNEVDLALARKGPEYFRDEYLFPGNGWASQAAGYKPFYERIGEQRVVEGKYTSVLRYREHVLPVFQILRQHSEALRFPGAA